MQSIIASEMAGAVETTSSATGLGGCSEVMSGGNGEVEKSWHCFSITAQNTISGSQGPGINDLCLSATVAHCAGATDKKRKLPPTSGNSPVVPLYIGSQWQEEAPSQCQGCG